MKSGITKDYVKKTKKVGGTNEIDLSTTPAENTVPVTTTLDKVIFTRLNKLRKTKGEMSIQPLIRLAVVNLLESSGH